MDQKALGKGLSALIPSTSKTLPQDDSSGETVLTLKVRDIRDNSYQPRRDYNEDKLADLKASIKEQGILQPILVRKKQGAYEVVAGERRLRAARALNFEEIPVVIKEISDKEALVLALVENIQRQELNAIEEAQAYKRLMEEFGYTQEVVAQGVSKDRSTVANTLRLLKLPEVIQKSIVSGEITMGHARALLSVENETEQKVLFDVAVKKGISVRELEKLVKNKDKAVPGKTKKESLKNPQIVSLEENLQRFLGTKVRIESKNKRGKVVIDFYSLQDLERIIRAMIKK